jgi:hypothetical protein
MNTDQSSSKKRGRPRGSRRYVLSASIEEWGQVVQSLDRRRLPVQITQPIASLAVGAYLGVPTKALGLQRASSEDAQLDAESRSFSQRMSVKSSFASKLYIALVLRAQMGLGESSAPYGSFCVYQSDLNPTSTVCDGTHLSLFRPAGTHPISNRMALNLMLGEDSDTKSFLRKFQRALRTLTEHSLVRLQLEGRGRGTAERVAELPKWRLRLTEQDRMLSADTATYKSRGMNAPILIPVPVELVSNGWLAALAPKELLTLFALYYQRISTPVNLNGGTLKTSWFLSTERRNQCGLSEETYRAAHRRLVKLGVLHPADSVRYSDPRPRGRQHDFPHEFAIIDNRLTAPPPTTRE